MDFSIVDSSAYGSIGNIRKPDFTTSRTDAEWRALWAEYKGSDGKPVPTIDFQSLMVVGIFGGEKSVGCTIAEVKRVVQEEAAVRVEYTEGVSPGVASRRFACGASSARPAVVAAIPRSPLPVWFLKVDQPPPPPTAAASPTYIENSYIVTFKPSSGSYKSPIWPPVEGRPRGFDNGVPFGEPSTGQSKAALAVELGIRGDVVYILEAINGAVLSIDAADAERLRKDPRVLSVDQNALGSGA
ncbi:hypothetical protein [Ramlibacter albus]|uniref:Uncharacterized protein n=1 Tax=Ramlibacter albus TaxID=2079448 RepID=A0A923M9S8_9BURK|nr:hypothetical protein [Ramlibacter albus]MBC5765122.1 hypothetical protein [Ramlibacter albus]